MPVAGAKRSLLVELKDRGEPRREVVLVGVVEVVRIAAEVVLLDEERLGLAFLFFDDRIEVVSKTELERQPVGRAPRILNEADGIELLRRETR